MTTFASGSTVDTIYGRLHSIPCSCCSSPGLVVGHSQQSDAQTASPRNTGSMKLVRRIRESLSSHSTKTSPSRRSESIYGFSDGQSASPSSESRPSSTYPLSHVDSQRTVSETDSLPTASITVPIYGRVSSSMKSNNSSREAF